MSWSINSQRRVFSLFKIKKDRRVVVGADRVHADSDMWKMFGQSPKLFCPKTRAKTSNFLLVERCLREAIVSCDTNTMANAVSGFVPRVAMRMSRPAGLGGIGRRMFNSQAPRVAVLFQAIDPPIIGGVHKPRKPGGK